MVQTGGVQRRSSKMHRTVVPHVRFDTHADGGLSTISQRCGSVRAWERRSILWLSSVANSVGIEAACVKLSLIKRETEYVTKKQTDRQTNIWTMLAFGRPLDLTLYEQAIIFL